MNNRRVQIKLHTPVCYVSYYGMCIKQSVDYALKTI